MKTWNFGIIGSGMIAKVHATAIQNIHNANLVGVCSSNPENARKFAEQYNY